MNEDINIRVLLLPPPAPGNDNVWEKSIIDIHSHSGSVIVEVAGSFYYWNMWYFLTKPFFSILTDSITRSRRDPPFSDVRYFD